MSNKYVYSITIVLIIIILAVFGLIFIPNPKNFYSIDYDGLSMFQECLLKLQEEVDCLTFDEHPIVELWKRQNHQLSICVLYDMEKIMECVIQCPTIYKLLRTVPKLISAKLYKVGANTTLIKSSGWNNKILEFHFPIVLIKNKKSGIWVSNEIKFYKENH